MNRLSVLFEEKNTQFPARPKACSQKVHRLSVGLIPGSNQPNELCTCGTLFSLISKKTTLHAFFVHFFAVVLHEYNEASRNFLVTLFMEEMLNVL